LRKGKESQGTLKVRKTKEGDAGEAGIFPPMEPMIGRVRKGYPADSAGMQDGDRVLTVNGSPVQHWAEMAQIIRKNPGQTITLGIERKGLKLSINVIPRKDSQAGGGLIGVERDERIVVKKWVLGELLLKDGSR
jgi:regulator of sigma E protease